MSIYLSKSSRFQNVSSSKFFTMNYVAATKKYPIELDSATQIFGPTVCKLESVNYFWHLKSLNEGYGEAFPVVLL